MDDELRALVNGLFAAVTAMLEDATEVAVAGQSPTVSAADLRRSAAQLHHQSRAVAAVADAAAVLADTGVNSAAENRDEPA